MADIKDEVTMAEILQIELEETRINELAELIAPKVEKMLGAEVGGEAYAVAKRAAQIAHQIYDVRPQRVLIEHDPARRMQRILIEVPMLTRMNF